MKSKTYFLLLFFLGCEILFAGNPVSVPINHPVYAFIDRMETLGILENIRDGVKPFDRGRMSTILVSVNSKRQQLTPIDQNRLDNFLADFRFEIDRQRRYEHLTEERDWYSPVSSFQQLKTDFRRFFQKNQPEEKNHIFLWEDSTNSFTVDFIQDFTFDRRSDDIHRSSNSQTYRVRGTLTEKFAYALEVSLVALRGDSAYRIQDPILMGTWNQSVSGKTFFDRSGGELVYRASFLDLRFAHQPTTWGLGESGQLILSNNVEQYPYFALNKNWKWGSFSFMHGKLLAEPGNNFIDGQPIFSNKWISAHRFEFSPISRLAIGLTELVIYGNRTADWAYWVPFNFYRATEHNLRDRDNETIALDLEARIFRGGKIYGTVFIDEFKRSKLFTDWWANKHAFQLGMQFVDPFSLANLTLRLEYVAVMPWVYTHKFKINRYINDGRSLGYWAGPNSQVIYANLEKDWHYRFRTGIKFQQLKHGDNYRNENIGGDILAGHKTLLGTQSEPRETRKFLEGILTTENRSEFYVRYEIFNDLFLDFSITHQRTRVSGVTSNLTTSHFGFKLDY